MQNGVRSSNEQKYSSSSSAANSGAMNMGAPLTNGRSSSSANPSSLFSKPSKLPPQDQLDPLQSLMPMPELPSMGQPPETPTKVEEILKMMTKQLVEGPPLSKIAATPRTEIEVQQPNKKHVYAELPPSLFKPPMKPRKLHCAHSVFILFYSYDFPPLFESVLLIFSVRFFRLFYNLAPLLAPISDEIKKLPPFNPNNSFPERERHPPLKPT